MLGAVETVGRCTPNIWAKNSWRMGKVLALVTRGFEGPSELLTGRLPGAVFSLLLSCDDSVAFPTLFKRPRLLQLPLKRTLA